MNVQTNAVSDSGFRTEAVAAAARVTRPMYWSVRRELWENRSIYVAPLAAAGVVLLAMFYGVFHGMGMMLSGDPAGRGTLDQQQQCTVAGAVIMAATFLVAVFYCMDALYGERRDRSILFWRSLPVSDTVAVLAKATVPLVILPALTFVIAVVTQYLVLGMDAAMLAAHGLPMSTIAGAPVLKLQAGLLYHLIAVHSLWYAPIYGWLLLVSAWARKAPILWAILPPLAIELVEKIAFNTSQFANFIANRFSGGVSGASFGGDPAMLSHSMAGATPGQFLASPGLWGGLLVTALFLLAAVQLRRYRTPI